MRPLVIQSAERMPGGALRLVAAGVEGLGWPLGAQVPEVAGRDATARESLHRVCPAEAWPALEMACLNLTAKAAGVPLYQFLGGPTRA